MAEVFCQRSLTPNKYLSAPYGEGLREVIRDTNSLDSIIDESRGDHFSDASVYPVITNFDARGSATRKEVFSIIPYEGGYLTISHDVNHLFALPNVNLGPLLSKNAPLLYRVLRQTIPLETICDVNASTTAGEADEFTVALYDAPTGISSDVWKVLNTGLIDPFRVRWGEQQLRHAKRIYQNPVFDRDASVISSRRKEHYSSPKLIFAKLASHPEVFVDENGEYAGLNVNFAFIEGDSAYFIAAQLNSLIGDWLYRQLFGALAMSGGYLQYQAPQIRAWPIQIFDSRNPLHVDVVQIARDLQSNNIDADLDCAVAKCFGLSSNDLSAMTESLHTLSEAQAVEGDLE